MKFLLLTLMVFTCGPAHAEWSKRDFTLSAVPFGGYHFGVSDFDQSATSQTGGLGLSHGPFAGIRMRAELERFFVAPDLAVGPLLGISGTPMIWSVGFIAGTRLGFSGFDVFAGLAHKDFFSYDGSGGTFVRLGAAFDLPGRAFQIFVEAVYGSFTRYAQDYQAYCPYYGIEGGIQFPIEFNLPASLR